MPSPSSPLSPAPAPSAALRLHDTLSGAAQPLRLRTPGQATLYVCGITPYDHCHLGHARTLVSFDILRRWMERRGLLVLHIQNVTDIDDKILKRAAENAQKGAALSTPLALSAHFDARSREDMHALGLLPPTAMPKISEHLPQTLALIAALLANGSAYRTPSGVYFDISTYPAYGHLSRQDLAKVRAGARVEVDEGKRHPEDFALWKFDGEGCAHAPAPGSRPDSPDALCARCATRESPWGRGRPGWHIECSAMSLWHINRARLEAAGLSPECMMERPDLLDGLDLHGGARDLIFPHHENEIAQSEAAGVRPFARQWAHTGFLTVEGEKMAKSLGNFITIRDALERWDGQTLRLFFSLTHYRSPVDFSPAALDAAQSTRENIRRSLTLMHGWDPPTVDEAAQGQITRQIQDRLEDFGRHMDNDLDTPQALAALIEASRLIARAQSENLCRRPHLHLLLQGVRDAFLALGLVFDDRADAAARAGGPSPAEIAALIAARDAARARKDWAESDRLRDELKSRGVVVEDSKGGARWRYA